MYKVKISREFFVDDVKKYLFWEGDFESKQDVVWFVERAKRSKKYFYKTYIKVSRGKNKKYFVF